MVFEEKYDNSLWLMVKSNKRVGNQVLSFFRRFPQELLIQIRESIKKYNESSFEGIFFKDEEWCETNLCGYYKCEDGLMYGYSIDTLGILEIRESFAVDDQVINLDCIILYPFDLKEINNMSSFYTFDLGMIGSGFTVVRGVLTVPATLLTEVNLMKCFFGSIVNSRGYLTNFKQFIHRDNIKNIPTDYSLDDIQQISNSKRLIHKKKSK